MVNERPVVCSSHLPVHSNEERVRAELGLVTHRVVDDGQENESHVPLGLGLVQVGLHHDFDRGRAFKRPVPVQQPLLASELVVLWYIHLAILEGGELARIVRLEDGAHVYAAKTFRVAVGEWVF